MTEVIYEKKGIKIERYECGAAGICYELELESEPETASISVSTVRRFTTEGLKDLIADLVELRIGREKSEEKVRLIWSEEVKSK